MPAKCPLDTDTIRKNFKALQEYQRPAVQKEAAKAAAEHMIECAGCAAGYLDEFFQLGTIVTDTLSGRTLPGPVQAPFSGLTEYEDALLASILTAREKGGGGVVSVRYRSSQRSTALAMFARLATRLRENEINIDVTAPGIPVLNGSPVALVLEETLLPWIGLTNLTTRLWVVLARYGSDMSQIPIVADLGPLPSTKGFEDLWQNKYISELRKRFNYSRLDDSLKGLLEWAAVPALAGAGFLRMQIPAHLLRSSGPEDDERDTLQILVQSGMLVPGGEIPAEEPAAYEIADPELAAEIFRAMDLAEQVKTLQAWRQSLAMGRDPDRSLFFAVAQRLVYLGMRKAVREWLKKEIPNHDQETYEAARKLIADWQLKPGEASAWAALLGELHIPLALKLAMEACDLEASNEANRHTLGMLYARRALRVKKAALTSSDEDLNEVRKNLAELKGNHVAEHSLIQFSLDTGRANEAAEQFGLRKLRPQTAYWTSLWIAVEIGRRNLADARFEADQWTKNEPGNARAWLTLASCYDGSDTAADIDHALEAVESALHVEPGLPAALTIKARILRDRGRLHEAVKALDDVLKNYPENEHALHLSADLLAERSDWNQANKYYDRLEDVDPGNFPALISRCDWLLKSPPVGNTVLDQVDARLQLLRPPLDGSPFARSLSARLQLARGGGPADMGGFRALFSESMNNDTLRYQLALAYAFLNRFRNIESDILIDPRRNPSVRGLNTLAMIYRIQARRHGALSGPAGMLYLQSRELDPKNLYTQRAFHHWWTEVGSPAEFKDEAAGIEARVKEAGLPWIESPVLFCGESDRAD